MACPRSRKSSSVGKALALCVAGTECLLILNTNLGAVTESLTTLYRKNVLSPRSSRTRMEQCGD